MISHRRFASAAALLILLGGAPRAFSQTYNDWQPTGTAAWETDSNWSETFVPDSFYDEFANISNGGTATVSTSTIPTMPGGILLGNEQGQTGSLIIQNGGQLSTVVEDGNFTQGEILVGADGIGHLTVEPGGTISGRSMIVGGLDVGSTLVAGAASGGVANISIENGVIVSRDVQLVGPNVNFASQTFSWYNTSTYAPEITAATHSAINVSGNLSIDASGAMLRPQFSGITPAAGDSWNLFDAGSINGTFVLDASGAPELPVGQVYRFDAVPDGGSTNGVYGQLSVDQLLVLNVDRSTGAMSIGTGPVSIDIDGYEISSGLGGLNPAGWSSLEGQSVADWRESPQGGSANLLSELKPTTFTTVTDGAPLTLGSTFQLPTPTEFGTELEDVTFEYYSPGGIVTQGIVNYTGVKQHNNLVLVVDPDTGEARMENESALAVDIDGYKISSDSGSLIPAQWMSLDDDDRAGGDWRESNPTATDLVELKPVGATTMTGGLNFGYDLGSLFQTEGSGGTEDVTFQYLFPGDTEFRNGVVEYRPIGGGSFLAADFNQDHTVDGADLALWKSSFGMGGGADANNDGETDGSDFLIWQRQFGMSSATPVAASVPEPSAIAMVLCMAGSLAFVATKRRA